MKFKCLGENSGGIHANFVRILLEIQVTFLYTFADYGIFYEIL